MKRIKSIFSLITVISLLLGVIWLGQAVAADVPEFKSLGQIRAEGMYVPGAIDLDAEGNIYVADGRNGHIFVFDKFGVLINELALGATGRGLAVTADGSKLFVSSETAVLSYDIAAATQSVFVADVGVAGEIDIDSHGYIYVVDAKQMYVTAYDSAGEIVSRFGTEGVNAGQFKQLGGLAIDAVDRIYVTDQAGTNGQVHVFTLDPLSHQVSSVVAYPRTSTGLWTALGATFDSQGRIYVVDYVKSMVRVYQPNMTKFANDPLLAGKGRDAGQLSDVNDVAFDAANNRLLVSCGSRLEVFGVDNGSNPVKVNHAPSTPAPQSPVAGSEVASLNPTLLINNATDEDGDAINYIVVVSRQDGSVVYQTEIASADGETTSVDVAVDLVENAAYFWTVQATDGQKMSAVSSQANFVVNAIEEAPGVPQLVAPASGDSVDGNNDLIWTSTTDPDPNDSEVSYQVKVAEDALFEQVVASASVSETAITIQNFIDYNNFVDGQSYFWQVVARDVDGTSSDASDPGQFVYDTSALTVTANIPGAKVSLNGNHVFSGSVLSEAPLQLRDLDPGSFSVVVERAGFETFVAQVFLTSGENVDLYAELVPAKVVDKLKEDKYGVNGRSGLSVDGSAAPFLVDFDNDGDLDLLVGDAAGQLTLFANMQIDNRNRLSFDSAVQAGLPTVSAGAVPFVADWNNDGLKDIIVGDSNGSVTLFKNTGYEHAPAFGDGETLLEFPVGLDAAPAVMYFDADDNKDLIVAHGDGTVTVFLNRGTDNAPVLATGPIFRLGTAKGTVMPIDWNADGQDDLLFSSGGAISVYSPVDGKYVAVQNFDDRRSSYVAAYPIALDNTGKQLLVGQADGEIIFLTGNNMQVVPSFLLALSAKTTELADLVDQAFAADVMVIQGLIDAGDFGSAAEQTNLLLSKLADDAALQSASELLALLNGL